MITFSTPQFPSVLMSICNNKVATHDNTMELSRSLVVGMVHKKLIILYYICIEVNNNLSYIISIN